MSGPSGRGGMARPTLDVRLWTFDSRCVLPHRVTGDVVAGPDLAQCGSLMVTLVQMMMAGLDVRAAGLKQMHVLVDALFEDMFAAGMLQAKQHS